MYVLRNKKVINYRRKIILELRRDGLTFREIGMAMGVGNTRAHQIYGQAVRLERWRYERPILKSLQNICQSMYQIDINSDQCKLVAAGML